MLEQVLPSRADGHHAHAHHADGNSKGRGARAGYELLSRNEFYVSRWAAWHMDTVWEPSHTPEWAPAYSLARNNRHLWETLPGGERYGIATVAVYLQDHTQDSAMKHRLRLHPHHLQQPAKTPLFF